MGLKGECNNVLIFSIVVLVFIDNPHTGTQLHFGQDLLVDQVKMPFKIQM
jgi:hypothetical protein